MLWLQTKPFFYPCSTPLIPILLSGFPLLISKPHIVSQRFHHGEECFVDDLLPSFPQSYHKNIKKMCQNGRKTQIICTEAAFAASLTHSSGPFLDFDFAFGVFSGESFAAVSFTRASSFSMADSLGSADFS